MAHLNPTGTDWVTTAFIVHPTEPRVLLVHHKALGLWLGVGGHLELDTVDASPDAALIREVREETGLRLFPQDGVARPDEPYDAYVLQTPAQNRRREAYRLLDPAEVNGAVAHWVPQALETHLFFPIPGHKHLALVYFVYAVRAEVTLEAEAHHAIRWFSRNDLADPQYRLLPTIQSYGLTAVESRYRKK